MATGGFVASVVASFGARAMNLVLGQCRDIDTDTCFVDSFVAMSLARDWMPVLLQ